MGIVVNYRNISLQCEICMKFVKLASKTRRKKQQHCFGSFIFTIFSQFNVKNDRFSGYLRMVARCTAHASFLKFSYLIQLNLCSAPRVATTSHIHICLRKNTKQITIAWCLILMHYFYEVAMKTIQA